ncbi:MAG: hypothetical protein ACRDQA_02400 [Nocardioidaceae bacterium]
MGKQVVTAEPGGAGITWGDFEDNLTVVEPLEFEPGLETAYGTRDAVRANVFFIKGKGKAEEFEDTLIFGKVLIGQVRRKIGAIVVGRLTKGEAKKGQNAPWVLAEGSNAKADRKKASTFLAERSVGADDDSNDDSNDDDDDAGGDEEEAF